MGFRHREITEIGNGFIAAMLSEAEVRFTEMVNSINKDLVLKKTNGD